ncbi:alpha/beta fold hydrolase [Microbacterium sp.]|uniref:S9 family peptidase n=1 Tax=Microbacterium sp. TaxID=51671 RepID=UPI003F98C56C
MQEKMKPEEPYSIFGDIDAFGRVARVESVVVSPSGRVVAEVRWPDNAGAKLKSSLWELDPLGLAPAKRLTFSAEGERAPRFCRDGSLVFVSKRTPGDNSTDDGVSDGTSVWLLPAYGEARALARVAGDLTVHGVADDGTILASTSVLLGSTLESDFARRRERREAERSIILHTGMPIRRYDYELGWFSTHLVLIHTDGRVVDLTPDADAVPLVGATADISPDGRRVVTSWTQRVTNAATRSDLVLIDTESLERSPYLACDDGGDLTDPVFSPDGGRVAFTRRTRPTPIDPQYGFLEIRSFDGAEPVVADVGDVTVKEYRWLSDDTVLAAGDLHSSGAVLAVCASDGTAQQLAAKGVFSSLSATSAGEIFALRNNLLTPSRPVRLRGADVPLELPAPGRVGELPGTLERVETEVDGVRVGGWLCRPTSAQPSDPAPAMLWIHGGPHTSYNTWGWRWNPWLAVARGYAVLMPDPAMSTGYGHAGLKRGWPRQPDIVFRECEELFDQVIRRAEIDHTRTAMLGGSFGGFMANWIAGHTDRFDAIVSHASLWALDQQHRTTDMATDKMRAHGHEAENADWYRKYSPNYSLANVTTPMLITHGNQDYRVHVSESLRMWWDLVASWDGAPETMPHRFLQMTNENHAVSRPSNTTAWIHIVLAFCDQHVLGRGPNPEEFVG